MLTMVDLEAGLDHLRAAPADGGTVDMIVRRPANGAREILDEATLDLTVGLVGDNWKDRPSRSSADGKPHPDKQLTVMNARCAALLAGGDRERMALAGDQLYLDLDIGFDNLPAGTRLAIGTAVIEITEPPHTGCVKFRKQFGVEAVRFVNSKEGKARRLRGANAKVVQPGVVRQGDVVSVLRSDARGSRAAAG
ncbi:MAG: MOSC domain-containing protein [Actinobacteria bacterium]|nr:MOSC domain-containing protein [Actinomycetota bacterium]